MYPASIILKLKDSNYSGDCFLSLLMTLYQLGYIFLEPLEYRRSIQNPELLELICTFSDKNASLVWQNDNRI